MYRQNCKINIYCKSSWVIPLEIYKICLMHHVRSFIYQYYVFMWIRAFCHIHIDVIILLQYFSHIFSLYKLMENSYVHHLHTCMLFFNTGYSKGKNLFSFSLHFLNKILNASTWLGLMTWFSSTCILEHCENYLL